jgi:hypothetical protein
LPKPANKRPNIAGAEIDVGASQVADHMQVFLIVRVRPLLSATLFELCKIDVTAPFFADYPGGDIYFEFEWHDQLN